MPTYDYECTNCGHSFDTLQNMSDAPLTQCPVCERSALKRLIGGGVGIIFKGSGFYVNDSRGGTSKSASSRSESSSADGTGSTESASDGSSGTSSSSSDGASSSSGGKKSEGNGSKSSGSESKKSDAAVSSSK